MEEQIKIHEASVIKLEPGKYYIIAFDLQRMTKSDLGRMANALADSDAKGVVVGTYGDPDEAIKVVEADAEKM